MDESKHTPVAWLHEDGRVIPACTMNAARRDGGAMLSSVSGYTTPLYASAPDLAAEVERLRQEKDGAYEERNRVVAAFARAAVSLGWPVAVTRTAIEGWSEDWHGCIYIVTPAGQASWHFHDSHAHLFADLPRGAMAWDGHTTPEKYERLHGMRLAENAELRRKVEALRSASVDSRGWLVEWRYHGSVQWLYLWSVAGGGFSFTADASKALRLARREDAEAVLEWARDTDSKRGLHSGTFLVTEHVWESARAALSTCTCNVNPDYCEKHTP